MISLAKAPEPQVLIDNAATWTADLLAAIAAGGDATALKLAKYRHPEIKEALKSETHRKCAYCESKLLHVTPGDIEHVVPKAVAPQLAFEWANLTLACPVCNNGKSSKEGFIDPYATDPQDEFEFLGPMICHRLGRAAAERTKNELKLNRMDLIDRRRERIDGLMDKLERLRLTQDQGARAVILDRLLHDETASDAEYTACVRSWVSAKQQAGQI